MNSSSGLRKELTLFPATALVVGAVIGSGIFVSTPAMARLIPNAPVMLGIWLLAGVMTFFGAMTQAELASQIPKTGGLYEYLRVLYGNPVGFLYGWANFAIAGSGAIAAIGFIFGSYTGEFVTLPKLSPELEQWKLTIPFLGSLNPLADIGPKLIGSVLILFLTFINQRGIVLGALIQSVSTSLKVLALLSIACAAAVFAPVDASFDHVFDSGAAWQSMSWPLILSGITMALSSAFWAYDGWGNVAYIAGEIKDASRNVPRAIIMGCAIFTTLYLAINVAYLYILPIDQIGAAPGDRIASAVMAKILGPLGTALIVAVILLSTFDTVNSGVLTNARVYYAMAHDSLFPRIFGRTHHVFHTPHISLWLQAGWSILLLISGSFDLIMSMYVFVNC